MVDTCSKFSTNDAAFAMAATLDRHGRPIKGDARPDTWTGSSKHDAIPSGPLTLKNWERIGKDWG